MMKSKLHSSTSSSPACNVPRRLGIFLHRWLLVLLLAVIAFILFYSRTILGML